MFITENERTGTCYFEFQYYKNNRSKSSKININRIKHWEKDSLLISNEDFDDFYELYENIFNCALLTNGNTGFDCFGPNYYDNETAEKLLQELKEVIDNKYNNLIIWLEKATNEYNGFYLLGL